MSREAVKEFHIKRIDINGPLEAEDQLAVEEPLEIRLIYGAEEVRKMKSIAITMRTPGKDRELAIGFLFTEGIIQSMDQVDEVFNNPEDCNNRQDNMINVSLSPQTNIDFGRLERHFYTSSSCGVCGKASIEAIRTLADVAVAPGKDLLVSPALLHRLPDRLKQQQEVFNHTGGLHAAALFDADGNLLDVQEDVGRHNALDKLIGNCFLSRQLPLQQHVLLLSGRASFELIQKAAMAKIPVIAAVGAPSSLAVQLAQEFGITLIGFLRNERFNIYNASHRVIM